MESFAQIAKADVKSGKERLGCLDGIRFMSISWVALCHIAGEYYNAVPILNSFSIMFGYVPDHYSMNILLNAFVSVDSFFLLSGCLVSYLALKEMEKSKGRINFFFFYLHRYLR